MTGKSDKAVGLGIDAAVDQVRPLVRDRLRVVEKDHDLRVLFACESGSRAWGFASDDSDFDVRFIYVRPAADYLKLRPESDAFDLHGDDDLDLAGWDVRKMAELMRKSNGPLLEWIDSPIVYEADVRFHGRLRELRAAYFDPKKAMYHYLSLAGSVWSKHIEGEAQPRRKKYLYVLRPLACVCYIERHGSQPPTLFQSVLAGIELTDTVRGAIDRLVADKRANRELAEGPADEALNGWIVETLRSGERAAGVAPTSTVGNDRLDRLIADTILGSV